MFNEGSRFWCSIEGKSPPFTIFLVTFLLFILCRIFCLGSHILLSLAGWVRSWLATPGHCRRDAAVLEVRGILDMLILLYQLFNQHGQTCGSGTHGQTA